MQIRQYFLTHCRVFWCNDTFRDTGLINSINSLESTKKKMSHLNGTRENIFYSPHLCCYRYIPCSLSWSFSTQQEGPRADLEQPHCFSLAEMESQLPLLGAKVPSSSTIVRLLMALLQMGLKSPCFSVLPCTPKRASKRLAAHILKMNLILTSEVPVTERTVIFLSLRL